MSDPHPRTGNFAERHAWQVFLALGVIYIYFGTSDLSEAASYDSKVAAMSLLVIRIKSDSLIQSWHTKSIILKHVIDVAQIEPRASII